VTETIEPMPARIDQQQLAEDLVEKARTEGVELIGPGGLPTGLTKTVLETALEAEMSEHVGYGKYDPMGRNRGNSRYGTRVLFAYGP
jgi:putative transposase